MSLQTLLWKRLTPVTVVSNTAPDILDAIYTALQATTYADGSSRTPGSASAHTVSRYQSAGVTQSIYGAPPTTTSIVQRWIMAGVTTGSFTPVMITGTFTADKIYCGLVRSAGSFLAWDNANPFTSGYFPGFMPIRSETLTTNPISRIFIYESQEGIAISLESTDNYRCLFLGGALVATPSTASADAEADGRIYGYLCTSSRTSLGSVSSTSRTVFEDSTTTTRSFTPGTNSSSKLTAVQANMETSLTSLTLRSLKAVLLPIYVRDANYFLGEVRGIKFFRFCADQLTIQEASVDIGYALSGSRDTATNSLVFTTG